jgi:cytochrome P450
MQKLADELTTAFASDKDMTIENTDRLPCLATVVEESLRLYTPAVPSFPIQVSKDGAVIDGG